ncbi:hypothetical protein [Pedobacter sp. Leaf250]|uniref:hypothetical protein n=1 Tax=Pedobacter sp. Leaf250 TaxID=2876559 RepID=UPI001E307D6C|nr:hypothetical protein [Pedobacter sp. Leaf250]
MKTEELFFIVRVEVNTKHSNLNETLQELEASSRFLMTNTPKITIIHTEILTTKMRTPKNEDHGA